MSADFILMEGIRMVDEWPITEKKIPSLDIVFRAAVDPGLIEVGGEDSEPAADPRRGATSKIRLTQEEERIFRRVDGTRTVHGIIDASGVGEFEVCRTLFDLLNRSIITPGRGAAPEAVQAADEGTPASPWPSRALLAVVLVLGLAAVTLRWSTPFAVPGRSAFLESTKQALLGHVSRSRLERIDRGVLAYGLAKGRLPEALSDVVKAGLLDGSALRDPWARPYHYTLKGNRYELSSDEVGSPPIERTFPPSQP